MFNDHLPKQGRPRAELLRQIEHLNISPIPSVALIKAVVAPGGQFAGLIGQPVRQVFQPGRSRQDRHPQ